MSPDAYIVWNWNPEFFSVGPITVRYYGILFSLAFLVGYVIIQSVYRRENKPESDLEPLLTYMMVGTVLGARLGHCFFYDPSFYLSNPVEILKIWKGGLASHGGAIGIFLSLYLFSRKHPDQPYLWLLDRMVIAVALGGFFIRFGNFFNSEIMGTPSELPWAIIFTRYDAVPRHPAMLYESFTYGAIFLGLFAIYRRLESRTPHGFLLGLFMVTVFTFRFFVEYVKERQAAYSDLLPVSVGQLLSIPLIIIGLLFLYRVRTQFGRRSSPRGA